MTSLLVRLMQGHRERIAGTVYGTIVALSVIVAGAANYAQDLWLLAAVTASSSVILWAAHVYSHGLGESVTAGRRLTASEAAHLARRESSIVIAVVLPEVAIISGAVGLIENDTAIWIALGLGVATLALQAARYAYVEELSRGATLATIALNLSFAMALVALKVALGH